MDDVRARIRSHLVALSTAGVMVACNHRACGKTDGGYGVVDPMPAPSCLDKGMPTATVERVSLPGADAGARALRIRVKLNIDGGAITNIASASGGQVVEQTTTGDGAEVIVQLRDDLPEPTAASPTSAMQPGSLAVVSFGVTCAIGPSTFYVRVSASDGGALVAAVSRW